MSAYLQQLSIRLSTGLGAFSDNRRELHSAYFKQAQQADGGFGGREGGSDLYYTGFALRGLAVLGELYGEVAERAANFLRGRLSGRESIVDFLSLIYGANLIEASAGIDVFAKAGPNWRTTVADALELLRREDGGYAKGHEGRASSTYHTFLVMLCLQLIEAPIPDTEGIVRFLMSQQAEDGGFHEIRASKRAGTNPTAAAIGALKILDKIDENVRELTLDFLCEMQTDEGGLRANTRIPIADVLSTFTGFLTLIDLGGRDEIDVNALVALCSRYNWTTVAFTLQHGTKLTTSSIHSTDSVALRCYRRVARSHRKLQEFTNQKRSRFQPSTTTES